MVENEHKWGKTVRQISWRTVQSHDFIFKRENPGRKTSLQVCVKGEPPQRDDIIPFRSYGVGSGLEGVWGGGRSKFKSLGYSRARPNKAAQTQQNQRTTKKPRIPKTKVVRFVGSAGGGRDPRQAKQGKVAPMSSAVQFGPHLSASEHCSSSLWVHTTTCSWTRCWFCATQCCYSSLPKYRNWKISSPQKCQSGGIFRAQAKPKQVSQWMKCTMTGALQALTWP